MSAIEEIQTIREATGRVGASILEMGVGPDGCARGRLRCRDGWHAAKLLVALGEADRRRGWSLDMARRMRVMTSSAGRTNDWAFVAYVHASVQNRIRFRRERGEIFAGPAFTWNVGVGDCDDHARLLYAILAAGGVPVRLAFLYREWREGPAHVCVQAFYDGAWHWCETTIAAELGEEPYAAAARLGILNARSDIAKQVTTMSESDLPPIPPGFDARTSPAQIARDARALQELGYLSDASGIMVPDDPRFRVAVQAFQRARSLKPDGLIGPITRGNIGELVQWYAQRMGDVATSRARGLDIWDGQGHPDFAQVKAAGFEFVIIKLTDGLTRQGFGIENAKRARAAGLAVSYYHYPHPSRNAPEDEAEVFAAAIAEAGAPDFPVAFDFEIETFMRAPFAKPQDPADVAQAVAQSRAIFADWATAFVRALKTRTGDARPVLLYFVMSFAAQVIGKDRLVASGLAAETIPWVADYGAGANPARPEDETPGDDRAPRSFRDGAGSLDLRNVWPTWAMWQTSGDFSSIVPGIGVHVDHDVFNGTIADLRGGATPGASDGGGGVSVASIVFLGLAAAGLAYAISRA